MLKAVIFDLDNTLIDFMEFKRFCCENAISAMIDSGLRVSRQKGMDMLYDLFSKHGIEDHLIFERFLKKVSGKVDYRKLAHAINAYRRARIGVLSPYPGTKRVLIRLKERGLKLGIVSDAPKLKAWVRLTAMGLDDFFDTVITLEDTGRMKPSRLPFRAALRELSLKPEECLMVGDRPSRDIKGARALGMKTCLARYGCDGKVRGKWDFEIGDISELAKLDF